MDRWCKEEVMQRVDVRDNMSDIVDRDVLKWFGHMERMSREHLTKLLIESESKDRRSVGRLCKRWLDAVENMCDARSLELCDAKVKCPDRDQWRDFETVKTVV